MTPELPTEVIPVFITGLAIMMDRAIAADARMRHLPDGRS
jgi:hypothetical protein